MSRAEDIASKLSARWLWDFSLAQELCSLAGMEGEWLLAKSEEKQEQVLRVAANKLGVVLTTPGVPEELGWVPYLVVYCLRCEHLNRKYTIWEQFQKCARCYVTLKAEGRLGEITGFMR